MKANNSDERRLASLVLLLRPSPPPDYRDGEIFDDDDDEERRRRRALEENGCDLLRFLSRLLRHYCEKTTTTTTANNNVEEEEDADAVGCAYLRIAARVAFLRYYHAPPPANPPSSSSSSSCRHSRDEMGVVAVVRECEGRLVDSLLDVMRSRAYRGVDIDGTDVEMSWAARGLCVELLLSSSSSSGPRIVVDDGGEGDDREYESTSEEAWTGTIDAMVDRRRRRRRRRPPRPRGLGEEGPTSSSRRVGPAAATDDERLMIETIRSILDGRDDGGGGGRSSDRVRRDDDDDDDEDEDEDDWISQFDISLLSCVRSMLQTVAVVDDGDIEEGERDRTRMPKWTPNTLFELIRWSQQKRRQTTNLTTDVYNIVLQYLHLCIVGFDGGNMRQLYSRCTSQRRGSVAAIDESTIDSDVEDDFAIAMRSFVFHGLLILSNVVPAQSGTKDDGRGRTTSTVSDGESETSMRGDIYSLVFKLWQLVGIDWLLVSESTAAATAASGWWWFPSEDEIGDERRLLGPTWPLCTLVRIAAGEYRIGLGRLITVFGDAQDSAETLGGCSASSSSSSSCIVSEVTCCARIIAEAVHLMTQVADDDVGANFMLTAWSPDALLHIRKSLEDALNSSVQYSSALLMDYDTHSGGRLATNILMKEREEVGQTCCLVMGTIAAELEADHLLAPHTSTHQTPNDEINYSSFACALRGGIIFCHSLGERQHGSSVHDSVALDRRSYEYHEPLTYLLPCVMTIVSNSISFDQGERKSNAEEALNFAIEALQKDDCLMLAMSRFLYRTSYKWRNVCKGIGPFSRIDDSTIQMTDSTLSTLKLCILIIIEFTSISTFPTQIDCLQTSLDLWKENLSRIGEWHCETLRISTASALNLISQCLLVNE